MAKKTGVTRRGFVVGGSALALSGCFGKFGATTSLYDWNNEVSSNKWLKWLVFLVLIILPVYALFMIADALVINTIEFFSGNNPVVGGHVKLKEGHTLASSRTDDPNVIRHEHREHGKLVQVLFIRKVSDDEMHLLNDEMELVAKVRLGEGGDYELFDAKGRPLAKLGPEAGEKIAMRVKAGEAPLEALHAEVPVMKPVGVDV